MDRAQNADAKKGIVCHNWSSISGDTVIKRAQTNLQQYTKTKRKLKST